MKLAFLMLDGRMQKEKKSVGKMDFEHFTLS
jgi:hypothetical protein